MKQAIPVICQSLQRKVGTDSIQGSCQPPPGRGKNIAAIW